MKTPSRAIWQPTGGQAVRLTSNECCKVKRLAKSYWLYVVWDPLSVRIQNPTVRLEPMKRQTVAARFFEIPAEDVAAVGGGS